MQGNCLSIGFCWSYYDSNLVDYATAQGAEVATRGNLTDGQKGIKSLLSLKCDSCWAFPKPHLRFSCGSMHMHYISLDEGFNWVFFSKSIHSQNSLTCQEIYRNTLMLRVKFSKSKFYTSNLPHGSQYHFNYCVFIYALKLQRQRFSVCQHSAIYTFILSFLWFQ